MAEGPRKMNRLPYAAARPISLSLASAAPADSACSFPQAICGWQTQAEAAIGGRDHVLGADQLGKALDPGSDEFRMFDQARRVANDPGRQNLALGQLHSVPDARLVLVPHIGSFE